MYLYIPGYSQSLLAKWIERVLQNLRIPDQIPASVLNLSAISASLVEFWSWIIELCGLVFRILSYCSVLVMTGAQ